MCDKLIELVLESAKEYPEIRKLFKDADVYCIEKPYPGGYFSKVHTDKRISIYKDDDGTLKIWPKPNK